jgi:hypothetical protein
MPPYKAPSPCSSGNAKAFVREGSPNELFVLKEGRILDLMLHKAPGPSDLLLEPWTKLVF